MEKYIEVIGAREHNLKNVNLRIPKNQLVCFTGVSGSGKSSLLFDTVYAEAQRQLIETFSSFARRRLPKINRPDVDEIRNITTTITIDQRKLGNNPRSTVGTATELYTYLRLLFSRCGEPVTYDSRFFGFNNPYGMCPVCKGLGRAIDVNLDVIIDSTKSLNQGALIHPHFKKESWYFRIIKSSGLFPMDTPLQDWSEEDLNLLLYSERRKLDNIDSLVNYSYEGIVTLLKRRTLEAEETPEYLERNGKLYVFKPCQNCGGSRINEKARGVTLNGKTIPELVEMELTQLYEYLQDVEGEIAEPIVNRMMPILRNLVDIGVGYLNLNRGVGTLSGGESQRVKMARQLGCDLTDLTYVFDEPSIGLHQKDISKLIDILEKLKEKGNSLFVVEHDPAVIRSADYVVDIGPEAGRLGGEVVFTGTYDELLHSNSVTGRMLQEKTGYNHTRREPKSYLRVEHATVHNLKDVSVDIPENIFVCVTGVAGSGKSSLIMDVFGQEHPDAVVIDQSRVAQSSRSNPATYTKVFDDIRKLFSKETGQPAKVFSFNSAGACPKCKGSGKLRIDMHFLETVTITCDECEGKRYKTETLEHIYNGKNISQVLDMTIEEAISFFKDKRILRKLHILDSVGLGYLTLGQPLSTLSGGEAQRIKLARELRKKGNLYILDEPTTGLHMADIEKLLYVIDRLVESGNTVIVIEHNLDVIKNSDWVIDMGPEGGNMGGEIIALGTPEEIAENPDSITGQYLRAIL